MRDVLHALMGEEVILEICDVARLGLDLNFTPEFLGEVLPESSLTKGSMCLLFVFFPFYSPKFVCLHSLPFVFCCAAARYLQELCRASAFFKFCTRKCGFSNVTFSFDISFYVRLEDSCV